MPVTHVIELPSDLGNGLHNLWINAVDELGNAKVVHFQFQVEQSIPIFQQPAFYIIIASVAGVGALGVTYVLRKRKAKKGRDGG